MAKLGERLGRIETGHSQRDLRTNSCSVASLRRDSVGTDSHTKILCRDKTFQPTRTGVSRTKVTPYQIIPVLEATNYCPHAGS